MGVIGFLTNLKKAWLVLFRKAGKFTQTHVQSRLVVLYLENNRKSGPHAIPIYEEAEIAIKAEGLFIRE